jgi:cellulose synthase/poly-beta-1,6-N-acetylglucosamine synthase-like glycosyltransferase
MVFEVLVVNDRSTDQTAEVLARFKMQYPNLTVITNTNDKGYVGKKQALKLGLQKAKHPYFILTDADCTPASDQWLYRMASGFNSKQLILGMGPYFSNKSFASKLTRWETLLTAQNYLSFALAGIPYMGVGRNMAYTRKLFEQSNQFQSHLQLPSGDDDLFVGQVANGANATIQWHSDALIWSEAPENFTAWWKQKRRHLSTSGYYKVLPSILLGGFGLAQLLFYTALIPVFIFSFFQSHQFLMHLVWILIVIKFTTQMVAVKPMAKKVYGETKLSFFPLWEFLVVVFLAIIHIQNKVAGRPKAWS